jgi:hypothetical protein
MKRITGWRSALHRTIEAHRRLPFAWDTGTDCAMFPADCVLAMTGEDLAAAFRGRYRTAAGAFRALKKAGHDDLASLVGSFLEEIPVMKASAGDIAALNTDDEFGCSLGVVVGETVAVRTPKGIGALHLNQMHRAFRVP